MTGHHRSLKLSSAEVAGSRNALVRVTLTDCAGQGGKEDPMNNLIWLVGAVVIVIAVLSFFGLR